MRSSPVSRGLFILFLLAGLAGWMLTGQPIYARLVYLALLVLGGAWLWTILSLRGVSLRRTARSFRASVGEVFEERFEVEKLAWPGCAWLEVINQSNLPMAGGSRLLTAIRVKQRRFYVARTLLTRRGAFNLGPTSLTAGDPFGLFVSRKQIPSSEALIVLPGITPLQDFSPSPGIFIGGKALRQSATDVTPHAAGVREYVPGDPMRRIHWPSTARRSRFMVKEFEQESPAEVWIFLDAQRDVQASLPERTSVFFDEALWLRRPKVGLPLHTFEYAISAAASLAGHLLREQYAVGLSCAASKFTVVSAEKGPRQLYKIMETLAFLQPDGEIPLLGLIHLQAKLLPSGSSVILITPSAQTDLLLVVEDLQHRRLCPIVVLIESETFGGRGGSDAVATGLRQRDVPVCLLKAGDDLAVKLTLPAAYSQQDHAPRSSFKIQG